MEGTHPYKQQGEEIMYYVRKTYPQRLCNFHDKDFLETLKTHISEEYKNWIATLDINTCLECKSRHGKVYLKKEEVIPYPPLHNRCRCSIKPIRALDSGSATNKGDNGADWWIKNFGRLPDYYISKAEAKNLGYKPFLGNLSTVAPGKMLTKGIYKNLNNHLPVETGRIWYEADINYVEGYRGCERIIFSNDGLIFVTYDHYQTFILIE